MNIRVVIEHDEEANTYSAVCPKLPGCTSCGDTEEKALANVEEPIELYLSPDAHAVNPNAKVVEVVV